MNNSNHFDCQHEQFLATTIVNRITDEQGSVTHFVLETKVHCSQCHREFVFDASNLPRGVDFNAATTSFEGEELRVPIKPNPNGRVIKSSVVKDLHTNSN